MKKQAFTLRWRVKEGAVLLFNRHMRQLTHYELTPSLIAWVHERLEWATINMLGKDTNATLVLSVDPQGEVTVSIDDEQPQPTVGTDDVVVEEGIIKGLVLGEGVVPSTVWLALDDGALVASATELIDAADTLAFQLATTQGIAVLVEPQTQDALNQAAAVFAVSDEFGFVPLCGKAPEATTLKNNLDKLFY